MQEKNALSETPERSRAELVRTGCALFDPIRQSRPHVVEREIGIRVISDVRHTGKLRHPGSQRGRVAKRATDGVEQASAIAGRI